MTKTEFQTLMRTLHRPVLKLRQVSEGYTYVDRWEIDCYCCHAPFRGYIIATFQGSEWEDHDANRRCAERAEEAFEVYLRWLDEVKDEQDGD